MVKFTGLLCSGLNGLCGIVIQGTLTLVSLRLTIGQTDINESCQEHLYVLEVFIKDFLGPCVGFVITLYLSVCFICHVCGSSCLYGLSCLWLGLPMFVPLFGLPFL